MERTGGKSPRKNISLFEKLYGKRTKDIELPSEAEPDERLKKKGLFDNINPIKTISNKVKESASKIK